MLLGSVAVGTALIMLVIVLGILLVLISKSVAAKWYGIFMIVGTGGYFAAIIETYLIPPFPTPFFYGLNYFLSIAVYRFCPYFNLMALISYSKLFSELTEKKLGKLLLIPVVIPYIIDFFTLNVIYNINTNKVFTFWITAIIGFSYVLLGYALCYVPLFKKRNTLNSVLFILVNSFILPISLFFYNLVPFHSPLWGLDGFLFWAYLIGVAILIVRFNVFGFRVKFDFIESNKKQQLLSQLTETERIIFNHLVTGKTKREIAEIENKSIATVRNQITSIYKKLGIKDRQDLEEKLPK
ncbi:MAG TPA: helix-turn-helix transcriptional regulator [Bacillota bacterium]|nr:helix-turn-helix transcriptional regulator [Bacillota bacterium]